MVQHPQRGTPLEDDVADAAFGACPPAPRRPPTRTDSTATPLGAELRSDLARGQRARITDGDGATRSTTTTTTDHPQRLWLTRLRTVRASDSAILQDLQYSRDHVGNVIEIDDEAQQTRWFDNAQVSPERTYSYDPLYRLSSATGRAKVGLVKAGVLPFPVELLPHGGAANPVLRRTTQSDVDDAAGNLTETVHMAGEAGFAYGTMVNGVAHGAASEFVDWHNRRSVSELQTRPSLVSVVTAILMPTAKLSTH